MSKEIIRKLNSTVLFALWIDDFSTENQNKIENENKVTGDDA